MSGRPSSLVSILVMVALMTSLMLPAMAIGQGGVDTGNISRGGTDEHFGIGGNDTYDISFRQASIREVLQFLAWIGDVNIVIPEGMEGVVNVSFRRITIGDALNSIVKANALEYTIEGNVIRVGKGEQFRESGEDLKSETFRLKFAPAREMAVSVKALLSSRGSVIEDPRTNSIVVRDMPGNIDNVRRFIVDVDIKDAQVLIESKILEATRSFTQDIGIQWGATKGASGSKVQIAGVKTIGQLDSGKNMNVNFSPTAPTSGMLIGTLFKGLNLEAQILAAEQRGDIYVISDPSIVTSNGRSANIRSGATLLLQGTGTVNIGTASGSNTQAGTGLQQIETGVQLTVTPQITINDYVKLDIKAVTSTPDFSRAVQGIPVIVDNTASTVVLVKDGETTVIGGLTRYSDSLTKRRVPYLHKIPVIGNLFKSRRKSHENTELMVFIKPTIIRVEGQEPAQMRIREVEERRAAMEVKPIIDPNADSRKEARMKEVAKNRRGNKYNRQQQTGLGAQEPQVVKPAP